MDCTSTTVPCGRSSAERVLQFDSFNGTHFYKIPAVIRDDYVISLEQAQSASIAHITVHRWSARVKEALSRDYATLLELHGGPLFAQHVAGDEKHLKFLHLFGFRSIGVSYIDSSSGKLIEVFSSHAPL